MARKSAAPGDRISRRRFLTATAEPEAPHQYCISSAVVAVRPGREDEMAARLASVEGVEVRGHDSGRLILVLEGPDSGAVGGTLAAISTMDGVIAANLVFEHVERPGR